MPIAFNLRTKRPPARRRDGSIVIATPDAVLNAAAAGASIEVQRDALWQTDAAERMGETLGWRVFPGVQQLDEFVDYCSRLLAEGRTDLNILVKREGTGPQSLEAGASLSIGGVPFTTVQSVAFTNSEPKSVPITASMAALFVDDTHEVTFVEPLDWIGEVRVELESGWNALRAQAEAEGWSRLLGEAVLLFKYGTIGRRRPLTHAMNMLRASELLQHLPDREVRTDFKAEFDRAMARPIEVPAALARPAIGDWLTGPGQRQWREAVKAETFAPFRSGTETGHELLAVTSPRAYTEDWSVVRELIAQVQDDLTKVETLAASARSNGQPEMLVGSTPTTGEESFLAAYTATGSATESLAAARSAIADRFQPRRSDVVASATLGEAEVFFEMRAPGGNPPGLGERPNRGDIDPPREPFDALPVVLPEDVQEGLHRIAQHLGEQVVLDSWQPRKEYKGPSYLLPAGRSDLLLVETNWSRYEAAEVADVVNVLAGESRVQKRFAETRSVLDTFFEVESETEETQEAETQNRSNIRQASSEIIEEDFRANGSVTVTSQGATVNVAATAEAGFQETTKATTEAVEEYAKSVTRRAEERVRERTLESRRQTLTVIERQESEGSFEGGTTDTTGIYRYVELISTASVKRYGVRTLYDFVIPEPAALLWYLAVLNVDVEILATKPDTELLESITVDNVEEYRDEALRAFGPIEFEPMPRASSQLGWTFAQTGGGENAKIATTGEIVIPEGFEATNWRLEVQGESEGDDVNIGFGFSVGGSRVDRPADPNNPIDPYKDQWVNLGRGGQATFPGSWESPVAGSVSIAVAGENFQSISGTVTTTIVPSPETMMIWRLTTYGAIVAAYERRKAVYDQARVAATAFQPEETVTLPVGAARRLGDMMRFEVQRAVLAIIRNEHVSYDLVQEDVGAGLPGPDLSGVDQISPEIQFLQQAFEWEQMSWVLYPYLWGRRSQWPRTILQDHPDPDFAAFLRAGAARVQLPVRPGFEELVAHYMETKEVYPEGIPGIGDPGHLAFIDEQLEEFDAPGSETNWPNPDEPLQWEVRKPTSLVVLNSKIGDLPQGGPGA